MLNRHQSTDRDKEIAKRVKEKGFLRILFLGDIVGKPGRYIVANLLPKVKEEKDVDFVIANGENAAGGIGLEEKIAQRIYRYGVNVITSGNHIWDKIDKIEKMLEEEPTLLRPLNYPIGNPGHGSVIYELDEDLKVGVINIQGRVFMFPIDCPFRTIEKELEEMKKETNIIIVDFHAEATSEKIAMAWFLDGKVSFLVGTHTHVQTNDGRIFPNGMAYLTDAGMCGPVDSVIGVNVDSSLHRFLYQTPKKFFPARGDVIFNGVIVDIDINTGKAKNIELINIYQKFVESTKEGEKNDNNN